MYIGKYLGQDTFYKYMGGAIYDDILDVIFYVVSYGSWFYSVPNTEARTLFFEINAINGLLLQAKTFYKDINFGVYSTSILSNK